VDGKITMEDLIGEQPDDEGHVIDAEQSDDRSCSPAHPKAALPPPG
jgi:hypothetical protein